MSKCDDGGPAFPYGQLNVETGQPINGVFSTGMSLLDWFAVQEKLGEDEPGAKTATTLMGEACPEYVADQAGEMRWMKWWAEASARLRYMRAAAMVAEKRRREGGGT